MLAFTVTSHVPASVPSPSLPSAFLQATHVSVVVLQAPISATSLHESVVHLHTGDPETSHIGKVEEQPEWGAAVNPVAAGVVREAVFEQTLHEPSE